MKKYFNIFDAHNHKYQGQICSEDNIEGRHGAYIYQEVKEEDIPVYIKPEPDGWYFVTKPCGDQVIRKKDGIWGCNKRGIHCLLWSQYEVIAKLNDIEWMDK